MIEILNRVSGEGKTGRKKITYENGKSEYVIVQSADEPVEIGTPINRDTLMALQGFNSKTITINPNGSITEINTDTGHTTTTAIRSNGDIVQTFVGDKTISKTIRISENIIQEVVS